MDSIKDILEKVSSYNIFNYLLPGIVFALMSKEFCEIDLIQENNFIGAFLYYFLGMIISRMGSLLIAPLLKKIKFVTYAEYKDFLAACKNDSKIEVLSEANNTYRTILSMFLLLMLEKLYVFLEGKYEIDRHYTAFSLVVCITILFLFSYRKQTKFITKRVDSNNQL